MAWSENLHRCTVSVPALMAHILPPLRQQVHAQRRCPAGSGPAAGQAPVQAPQVPPSIAALMAEAQLSMRRRSRFHRASLPCWQSPGRC